MKLKKIQILMISILAVLVTMLFTSLIVNVGQMTTLEKLNLFEGADIEPDEKFFRIVYEIDYEPTSSGYYLYLFYGSHRREDTCIIGPISWNWLELNGYICDGQFLLTKSMALRDLRRQGFMSFRYDMDVTWRLEAKY